MPRFLRLLAAALALAIAACGTVEEHTTAAAPRSLPPHLENRAVLLGTEADAWERLAGLPWPQGGQTTFRKYESAREVLWKKLYPEGGEELYCGVRFESRTHNTARLALQVEHVYPAGTITKHHGCRREDCEIPEANYAMADLHNLWPAIGKVNGSRSNHPFGRVEHDDTAQFDAYCPDFRREGGPSPVVEPRDSVKGDVARSLVYMHFVYGLPLEKVVEDKSLLLSWMQTDPPDTEEFRRNSVIDGLQKTPNPLLMEAFSGF